jgi:putative transposase
MSQSLARVLIHLVFSTKDRQPWIPQELAAELHNYLGGIHRGLDCPAIEINSQPDHVHILFVLARTRALCDVIAEVKRGSSVWIQERATLPEFHWQAGYGAFSVSQSNVPAVRAYIRNQAEHHRQRTFQEEFREFLTRHGIEFDEQYVWD